MELGLFTEQLKDDVNSYKGSFMSAKVQNNGKINPSSLHSIMYSIQQRNERNCSVDFFLLTGLTAGLEHFHVMDFGTFSCLLFVKLNQSSWKTAGKHRFSLWFVTKKPCHLNVWMHPRKTSRLIICTLKMNVFSHLERNTLDIVSST